MAPEQKNLETTSAGSISADSISTPRQPEAGHAVLEQDSGLSSDLKDFGRSLFISAIENPVNALSQLGSLATEPLLGDKLPELHIVEPSAPKSEAGKLSQQVGAAIGLIVPFVLARSAVGFTAEKVGLNLGTSIAATAAEQGATGAFMGFALTPTGPGQGFWQSRLKSAAVDAGTFAAMGATARSITPMIARGEIGLPGRLLRSSTVGALSGIPGGFANAELTSLVSGKGPAKLSDLGSEIAGFAAFGGLMGAATGVRSDGKAPDTLFTRTRGETTPKSQAAPDQAVGNADPREASPATSERSIGGNTVQDHGSRTADTASGTTSGDATSNRGVDETTSARTESTTTRPDRAAEKVAVAITRHDAEAEADIARRFAPYTSEQLQRGRQAVISELSQVKASPEGGQQISVYDKFLRSNLSPEQREQVLSAMAAVRENHVSFIENGKLNPDQEKNWIHTQGEFGRVLDSAREMKMTPNETEDALLGSMFSDAVKTPANFRWHHIDGAAAAGQFLRTLGLPEERVHGVVQAAKEHQIGPPGFMSMIYTGAIKSHTPLQELADPKVQETIQSIGTKIANPFSFPLQDTGEGGKAIAFTPEELGLLKLSGVDKWHVPHPDTPWYRSSRALINGDSIDNYATPGGFSKLVGLNGPETDRFFQDATIDASLQSPRRSFKSAYTVMTPEGQSLADAELTKTDAAIARAKARTEAWLRETKGIPDGQPLPKIPFWNSDLQYPVHSSDVTDRFWDILKTAPENRTGEEQAFFDQHRYDGLNAGEIADFNFAKSIRDKMVEELRKEQRLDGKAPPEYKPVMKAQH